MKQTLKKVFSSSEKMIIFFCIFATLFLISNTLTYTVTPKDDASLILNNNWSISFNGDSSRSSISLPYDRVNNSGERFDLYTTLPKRIHSVDALSITVFQKSVWIYVDGKLIYEHEFIPKALNPNPPGSGNVTVILPADSSGKELHIQYRTEISSGQSFLMPPRIVNGAVSHTVFSGNNILIFACMVSFLFVALLLFVMSVVKRHSSGDSLANLSLSLVFTSIAVWVLCYNRLTDVIINNWSFVHELEYLSLYIVPFSIWNYMVRGWNSHSRLVKVMRNLMGLFYVGVLCLRLLFSIDYSQILTFFHILILINIVLFFIEFISGFRVRQFSYKVFAVGICTILFSAVLALIQQYFLKGELYLSLVFTLITAIAGVLMIISVFCIANENLSDQFSNTFMTNLLYEHKRYETILQNTGDIFFDWDTITDTAYISSGFEKYFGISPTTDNFGKFLCTEINGLTMPDNFLEILHNLKMNSENAHIECMFNHPAGYVKWFFMDLTSSLDHTGERTHIIGIIQDISEQRNLEKQYHAQIQYNHIATKMYDNVLEADLSTNILLGANSEALCTLLQIPVNSTYDETISAIKEKLSHPDYSDEYGEALSRERILSLYESGITDFELETYELDSEGIYQWLHMDVQIYRAEITNTVRILIYINNISQEKQREILLMEASLKDTLTGLLNKGALRVSCEHFLEHADPASHYALFMIDIDYFKQINDKFGHITGDTAITHVASLIKSHFRESDFVGRFGGDEFSVLLTAPITRQMIIKKCETLKQCIKQPFHYNGVTLYFSLSIGVAFFPSNGSDYKTLCIAADKALYMSKEKGRDAYTIL